MSNLDTLSDGRSAEVAAKEIRNHISRLDAEYAGLNNVAAMREALAEYFGFDYVSTTLTLLLYYHFRQDMDGGDK